MVDDAEPGADKRSEGRSNVFLAATLHWGGASLAVRIRNLSSNGALIEGAQLPPVGTKVILLRGSLTAKGELAWHGGRQAGLNFDLPIHVASWVERVGHAGQQRVDAAIAAIKRSEPLPTNLPEASSDKSLAAISAALDQLCERLAQNPAMNVQLAEELLKLDAIAQDLRQLSRR